MGNLDQAFQDADQAIRLNPDFARAYVVRGSVYLTNGDKPRALSDFQAFLRLAAPDENPNTLNHVRELVREIEAEIGTPNP
jgi:regulator of sirC expression with transglutaminase-like and TPR domain